MKPTTKQLRYLRDLAHVTGTTFVPPTTSTEASREIARLKARPISSLAERGRERRQVQDDLARGRRDAVRHRANETDGHGSTARWAHHFDRPGAQR